MPYAANGNIRIYYEIEEGDWPPLVFIHGWTANMNFWREQRRHFSNRMLFIDSRGHGRSDKPADKKYYEFENFVSDVECVIEDAGLERFVLIGHSFGTMISMKYCVEYPEKVLALILIGGGARIRTFHKYGYPLAKIIARIAYIPSSRIVANMSFGKNAGDLKEWGWMEAMKHTPQHSALNVYRTLTKIDLRKDASRIDKPTLLIVGESDAMLPVSKSAELNRIIRDSKLVVIPDAGHCVMLERPDDVNEAIDSFLSTVKFKFSF
ncbi:alpha/beta fold hydrolase [Archaeoglobus neptunius]|uniref:alpha/beta fold hydrolase n=1 Tax=Archaeoglobus neptunius TaxID=2798580 RepID=UPI0019258AD9|nr:alpha/beta hydrolase [Archaeoglobus neptunius]